MGILPLIVLLAASSPQVQFTTLQGEQQSGDLQKLTSDALTVQVDGDERNVPLAQLLEIRFPDTAEPQPAAKEEAQIRLRDGSRLGCSQVEVQGKDATLTASRLGRFELSRSMVASIRFQVDASHDRQWEDLLHRETRQDMLIVVNENHVLDHLDGVIGDIDKQSITFLLDGTEIPVKRPKVYGIIYARRKVNLPEAACEVDLAGFDFVRARRVAWDGEQCQASLVCGAEVTLPLDGIRSLDFSLGKVRYLAQMEPRDVQFTPYFDDGVEPGLFQYRRDRNQEGGPLRLGGKTYGRGLWIHSRTRLRYRIDGEYTRFRAIMGIDEGIAKYQMGDVHVVIRGDDKPLLSADVKGADPPREIDLDITGVRDLEIFVDFGGNLNIADHLDLADAKVIK